MLESLIVYGAFPKYLVNTKCPLYVGMTLVEACMTRILQGASPIGKGIPYLTSGFMCQALCCVSKQKDRASCNLGFVCELRLIEKLFLSTYNYYPVRIIRSGSFFFYFLFKKIDFRFGEIKEF